ncbi:MAG: GntR family transcriptional regulator [Clostridia bacterium]|nr:GntR family transcriptional regulator [Clostridia bacterium]
MEVNGKKYASAGDYVFEILENEILGGVFHDGDVLTEQRLCERLGVSRTPVREALFRLKQEHLVEERTHGICVVGVTEQDLYDIYEIRKRIEGYATGRCASLITHAQLRELREIVDLQEFYTSKGVADNIRDTDTKFHELIYDFCGSRMLQATLTDLHRKVRKYRKLSVEDPNRAYIAMCEHRDILDALSKHDSAEAEYLAILHIENARKNIVLATKSDGQG